MIVVSILATLVAYIGLTWLVIRFCGCLEDRKEAAYQIEIEKDLAAKAALAGRLNDDEIIRNDFLDLIRQSEWM